MFPDVVLKTPRLTLRPFEPDDVEAVLAAANDPETQRWLPLPRPYLREHAEGWCGEKSATVRTSGQGIVRAVERDGRLAGCIDLKHVDWTAKCAEIGYWTAPDARGAGVITEATRELARWALAEMGFERVELRIAPGNTASLRVAVKAGFVREGIARNAGLVHDGRVDLVVCSLISADLDR